LPASSIEFEIARSNGPERASGAHVRAGYTSDLPLSSSASSGAHR
jgi:hypothetical protein